MPGMDESTAELILSIREDERRRAVLDSLADGAKTVKRGERTAIAVLEFEICAIAYVLRPR